MNHKPSGPDEWGFTTAAVVVALSQVDLDRHSVRIVTWSPALFPEPIEKALELSKKHSTPANIFASPNVLHDRGQDIESFVMFHNST